MKHVAGNLLSRFTDFLTSDGEKPWRNRDDEFVDSFGSIQELMDYWQKGWTSLADALDALQRQDLDAFVMIRGERLSVPLAISRSLSHCGYHVGQIVLISRILMGDGWKTLNSARWVEAAQPYELGRRTVSPITISRKRPNEMTIHEYVKKCDADGVRAELAKWFRSMRETSMI